MMVLILKLDRLKIKFYSQFNSNYILLVLNEPLTSGTIEQAVLWSVSGVVFIRNLFSMKSRIKILCDHMEMNILPELPSEWMSFQGLKIFNFKGQSLISCLS